MTAAFLRDDAVRQLNRNLRARLIVEIHEFQLSAADAAAFVDQIFEDAQRHHLSAAEEGAVPALRQDRVDLVRIRGSRRGRRRARATASVSAAANAAGRAFITEPPA